MSKILVVDDDHNAAELFVTILRHYGHQVTSALSGKAALDHLEGCKPNLVILDMMMPSMNGLEVLQQIRADARTADIQVVIFAWTTTNARLRGSGGRQRLLGQGELRLRRVGRKSAVVPAGVKRLDFHLHCRVTTRPASRAAKRSGVLRT